MELDTFKHVANSWSILVKGSIQFHLSNQFILAHCFAAVLTSSMVVTELTFSSFFASFTPSFARLSQSRSLWYLNVQGSKIALLQLLPVPGPVIPCPKLYPYCRSVSLCFPLKREKTNSRLTSSGNLDFIGCSIHCAQNMVHSELLGKFCESVLGCNTLDFLLTN